MMESTNFATGLRSRVEGKEEEEALEGRRARGVEGGAGGGGGVEVGHSSGRGGGGWGEGWGSATLI